MATLKVIDISKWQGEIDFAKVKRAGIDGVIIRGAYRGYVNGQIVEDPYLKAYINGCKENKIPVGFYFFSQAINETEGREEGRFLISLIEKYGYRPLFPVYIDVEWSTSDRKGRADKITVAERTKVVKAFCDEVEKLGYYAGVYSGTNFFDTCLNDKDLKSYDHWVADYRVCCGYKGKYGMWQYSSSGSVQGINGRTDMNHCYIDYPVVINRAGLNKIRSEEKESVKDYASDLLKSLSDIEKTITYMQDRLQGLIE